MFVTNIDEDSVQMHITKYELDELALTLSRLAEILPSNRQGRFYARELCNIAAYFAAASDMHFMQNIWQEPQDVNDLQSFYKLADINRDEYQTKANGRKAETDN